MKNSSIRPYAPAIDAAAVSDLWQKAFSTYPIAKDHLALLLDQSNGLHFVLSEQSTLIGFCACYVPRGSSSNHEDPNAEPAGTGFLAFIIISPAYRGRGYGTNLLQHSISHLWNKMGVKEITVGSVFPRFWPGIPIDLSPKISAFFSKNGFKETERCRDLYRPLTNFTSTSHQYLLDRADSAGFTFRPLHRSEFSECLSGQEENFNWAAAYKALHEGGIDHEIFTAFDADRKQAGWCLALSPGESRFWGGFAFLPIVGGEDGVSGDGKMGLICAVGTRKEMRGKGVGLAMLVKALEDMKAREGEIEACFIDSVAMPLWDWYKKLGFATWREYIGMKIERPK